LKAGLVALELLVVRDDTFRVAEAPGEDVETGLLETENTLLIGVRFTLLRLVVSLSSELHLGLILGLVELLVRLIGLNLLHLLGDVGGQVFAFSFLPLVAVLLHSAKSVKALFFSQLTVLAKSVNANDELNLAVLEGR
jgi:hypothetical protein